MKSARLAVFVALFAVACSRGSGSSDASPAATPGRPTAENANRTPGPGQGTSCYIGNRFCVEAPRGDEDALSSLEYLCEKNNGSLVSGTCTQTGHVASCVFPDDHRKIRYYNMTREKARTLCEDQGRGTLQDTY